MPLCCGDHHAVDRNRSAAYALIQLYRFLHCAYGNDVDFASAYSEYARESRLRGRLRFVENVNALVRSHDAEHVIWFGVPGETVSSDQPRRPLGGSFLEDMRAYTTNGNYAAAFILARDEYSEARRSGDARQALLALSWSGRCLQRLGLCRYGSSLVLRAAKEAINAGLISAYGSYERESPHLALNDVMLNDNNFEEFEKLAGYYAEVYAYQRDPMLTLQCAALQARVRYSTDPTKAAVLLKIAMDQAGEDCDIYRKANYIRVLGHLGEFERAASGQEDLAREFERRGQDFHIYWTLSKAGVFKLLPYRENLREASLSVLESALELFIQAFDFLLRTDAMAHLETAIHNVVKLCELTRDDRLLMYRELRDAIRVAVRIKPMIFVRALPGGVGWENHDVSPFPVAPLIARNRIDISDQTFTYWY